MFRMVVSFLGFLFLIFEIKFVCIISDIDNFILSLLF